MKTLIRITAFIIAAVLMAFSFASCAFTPVSEVGETEIDEPESNADTKTYSLTFYTDEVPTFVADQVKKGTIVYDSHNDVELGLVTEVLNEDPISYASQDGKLILTKKTGYRSLMITVTVEATEALEGWYVGEALYGIGHKDTLHIGNVEAELTLRSIEELN